MWKIQTQHRDLFNTKTQKDLPNETEQSLMLLYWYNPRHLQELKILAASGTCNCIKLAVDNRNVMKQKMHGHRDDLEPFQKRILP